MSIALKDAFYLNTDKSIRTAFLSDVELQSYAGDMNRILYNLKDIIKIGEEVAKTEKFLFGKLPSRFPLPIPLPGGLPPLPCPVGIWDWEAISKIIMDYLDFDLEEFIIVYKEQNLVKDFNLVPIEGTDYQLLEATVLDFPIADLRFRDGLPTVNLVFKGKNKTISLDELQVIPNNSLLNKGLRNSNIL